jgi:hypothetical protein
MAAFESFRAVRWIRTLNLILQAVLFLTLFGGLNYVASNHPWRQDLTRHRKFSLSPETLSYIKNLPRPVEIIVTLSEENNSPEIRGLLDEYVHATEGNPRGKITTRYIDVYQDRRQAEDLGIDQPNILLLRAGDKPHVVRVDDLYQIKNREREAFRGEQVLTGALLEITDPNRKKIYFVTGHGELGISDTDPRGLSVLRNELRVRNFVVDGLDLTAARGVPADASLLIIVAPQSRYTPAEQEMLRKYLGVDAGRLIVCLAPGERVDRLGLDDLLFDWGVLVDNDIVLDLAPESIAEDGDLIVWAFEPHPVTQILIDENRPLRFGRTRTVRVDPGRNTGSGLTVLAVAATSPNAWGELNYTRQPFSKDAADIHPMKGIVPEDRLSVIVASEKISKQENLPFSVRGGRLVAYGTGDFISNQRIAYAGNLPTILSAVNWTVDRDPQLAVPPRPIERFQLALSGSDFMKLRYALVFGLPGITLVMGIVVYWTRRS